MKNSKGITLIALIITIIIMLILVAVTVAFAINGGLFEKAKTSSTETEKKQILEEIIGFTELETDGEINVDGTIQNVKDEFGNSKVNDVSANVISVKGELGTYKYKITENEIIIYNEDDIDNLIPTSAQKEAAYYSTGEIYDPDIGDDIDVYLYTFDEDDNIVYCECNKFKYIQIETTMDNYLMWPCSQDGADFLANALNTTIEPLKWYVNSSSTWVEYTGTTSPISLDNLTVANHDNADKAEQTTAYIQRIINSF